MFCHSIHDMKLFGLDEIKSAASEDRLLALEIEFSQKSNFQNPFCHSEKINDGNELTCEEIRNVILQAKTLGAKNIVILGGEPMIYPDIMDQIRFIREEGLDVEIFTDGSDITEFRAKELAELNVKVVLKMYSLDRDKHNKFYARNDAYDIVQQGLKNLTSAGYGKGGKPLAIASVISKDNIDELESFWLWLREREIEPYFEMITPQDSYFENDNFYVDINKVETLFYRLAELDSTSFNKTWNPQPPMAVGYCLRHKYSLYVNAYGDVFPCKGIAIVSGNIRVESLSRIIQDSEVIQDIRNHRDNIKSFCADCDKIDYCYGCRGVAYQMTGDYLESDPLCWRFQNRKDEIQYLPVSVDNLIPQAKPMQFVNTLICVGDRSAIVEAEISEDWPMVDENGILLESAYIEIIAQASAAHNGFRSRNKKNKHKGYLLGAKNFRIFGQGKVGDCLTIKLRKEAKFGEFGVLSGQVYRNEELVAEGEIKVYSLNEEVT